MADATGVVGQQPFKAKAKFDILNDWKYTDKLNKLREFTFTVPNDEFHRANALVERKAFIPFIVPFYGFVNDRSSNESTITLKITEFAFHLTRKIFRINNKPRILYGAPLTNLQFEGDLFDTTGSNDGSMAAGTATYTFGKMDQGFLFDGTRYITLANESAFDFERTSKFSVSFWIKPANISSNQGLIVKSNDLTTSLGWKISINTSGEVVFGLADGTTNFTINSSALTINEWYHIICTFDGSSNESGMNIYVDSILNNNNKISNAIGSTILNAVSVAIGAESDGGSRLASGTVIDDVRVYPRELSSSGAVDVFKQRENLTDDHEFKTYTAANLLVADILTSANADMPVGVVWSMSDDFPIGDCILEFHFDNHYESLLHIAENLGKDLFFNNRDYKIHIETKGKTLDEQQQLDVMITSDPSVSTDNFANTINVLGKTTTTGEQLEKNVTTSTVLRYNYEKVVSNNQINTQDHLSGVASTMLNEYQKLTPSVKGEVPYTQFIKYNIESGDRINLIQPNKQLKSEFRVMDVTATTEGAKVTLESTETGLIRSRNRGVGEIISDLIKDMEERGIES